MSAQVGVATGAGRGMGRTCAERLARWLDVVVLADIDQKGLDEAAAELAGTPARIVPLRVDVSDPADVSRLAGAVAGAGSLRAVAHAAGISPTMADWRRVLTVDLTGTARLLRELRPLAARGTAIVCFASMAADLMLAGASHPGDEAIDDPLADDLPGRLRALAGPEVEDSGLAYAWAKRGVKRLVRREAVRLGPLGARICSVSPGMIDTPQGRQEMAQQPMMKVLLERTPLGRLGSSDEIAAVVDFLLSDEAGFLTGTDILVDGGVVGALTLAPGVPAPEGG